MGGRVQKIRQFLLTPVVFLTFHAPSYSQTVKGPEPISVGGHETVAECKAAWGKGKTADGKPDDCYCGAYANEVKRNVATGIDATLSVSFSTDPLVSGPGKNFGCWYLTKFKVPTGYVLSGYSFNTITGFGSCTLSFGHGALHPENYQECQQLDPPEPGSDLEFKYRIKGSSGLQNHFNVTKSGVSVTQDMATGINKGGALITLEFSRK